MTINLTRRIDAAPVSGFQIRIVALCALVALLDGLDIQAMAITIPRLAQVWDVPVVAFGPVLSASFAGIMVGTMLLGWFGDRFGRRRTVLWGFLVLALSSIGTSFATSIPMLIVLRFFTGAAIGGCLPNVTALTSEYVSSRNAGAAVTLMYSAVPLGGVIGSLVAGDLIAWVDWHGVFLLGGLAPLIVWVMLLFWLPESVRYLVVKGGEDARIQRTLARLDPAYQPSPDDHFVLEHAAHRAAIVDLFREGRTPATILLWITFFFSMAVMYLLASWLPTIFTRAGWSMTAAIHTLALFQVGGIVGGVLGGWLLDRIGAYRVLAGAFAVGTVAILAIAFAGPMSSGVRPLVILAGFGIVGAQLVLTAVSAILYPTAIRSTGVGWALGLGRLGAVLSPWAGGLAIAAGASNTQLFLMAAIPAFICTLASIGLAVVVKTHASTSQAAPSSPAVGREELT